MLKYLRQEFRFCCYFVFFVIFLQFNNFFCTFGIWKGCLAVVGDVLIQYPSFVIIWYRSIFTNTSWYEKRFISRIRVGSRSLILIDWPWKNVLIVITHKICVLHLNLCKVLYQYSTARSLNIIFWKEYSKELCNLNITLQKLLGVKIPHLGLLFTRPTYLLVSAQIFASAAIQTTIYLLLGLERVVSRLLSTNCALAFESASSFARFSRIHWKCSAINNLKLNSSCIKKYITQYILYDKMECIIEFYRVCSLVSLKLVIKTQRLHWELKKNALIMVCRLYVTLKYLIFFKIWGEPYMAIIQWYANFKKIGSFLGPFCGSHSLCTQKRQNRPQFSKCYSSIKIYPTIFFSCMKIYTLGCPQKPPLQYLCAQLFLHYNDLI